MNKRIIITGASGMLGSLLTDKLYEKYNLLLISSRESLLKEKYPLAEVCSRTNLSQIVFKPNDIIVHAGFSRTADFEALGNCIHFTKMLLEKGVEGKVKGFINISSRSVYGQQPLPWIEQTPLVPNSAYALGKMVTEELTLLSHGMHPDLYVTNIRLAGLISEQLEARLLNQFVKKSLEDGCISVIGGKQQYAYLFIEDAAEAIVALISSVPEDWKPVYNVGHFEKYTIEELARKVVSAVQNKTGKKTKIQFQNKDISLLDGMDCRLFYSDVNWKPKFGLDDMIERIIRYELEK